VSDLGFGAMLFGPEHALQVAAKAVEERAESTDMAVGIILGIRAAIEEYTKLFSPPASSQQNDPAPTQELPKSETKPGSATNRVAGLSKVT
jgi:hypothetical protein